MSFLSVIHCAYVSDIHCILLNCTVYIIYSVQLLIFFI